MANVKLSLLARLEAKPGKEAELEKLLRSALAAGPIALIDRAIHAAGANTRRMTDPSFSSAPFTACPWAAPRTPPPQPRCPVALSRGHR